MNTQTWAVVGVDIDTVYPWLTEKHYAKRMPAAIMFAYGLYVDRELRGVCTFSPPCRAYNDGEFVFDGLRVRTVELSRLCIDDDMPRNSASWFVARCLQNLPTPMCVVSYADDSKGHVGYVYQAGNWIYTGLNEIHDQEYVIDGKVVHSRTVTQRHSAPKAAAAKFGWLVGCKTKKHRYFMFLGDKKSKAEMIAKLRMKILPYPKGDTARHDSPPITVTQPLLF